MTSPILEAYKTSFEKYLAYQKISFIKENDIYKLSISNNKPRENFITSSKSISLEAFLKKFSSSKPEEAEKLLLPYIAWLRNNKLYKNYSYSELLKLAFNTIVSYNI